MHTLISAHRGGADLSHEENSRAAFEHAALSDCDYIEFDVRRTKDNVFVITHDATMFIGRKQFGIVDLEFNEVLSIQPNIVMLDDLLGLISDSGKGAHVDLKFTGRELNFMEVLDRHVDRDNYVITTHHDSSITVLSEVYGDDVRLGLSLGRGRNPKNILAERIDAQSRLKLCGANVIVAEHRAAREYLADLSVRMGHDLLVWTPNKIADIEYWLKDERCWIMTTDNIDEAVIIRDDVRW